MEQNAEFSNRRFDEFLNNTEYRESYTKKQFIESAIAFKHYMDPDYETLKAIYTCMFDEDEEDCLTFSQISEQVRDFSLKEFVKFMSA